MVSNWSIDYNALRYKYETKQIYAVRIENVRQFLLYSEYFSQSTQFYLAMLQKNRPVSVQCIHVLYII